MLFCQFAKSQSAPDISNGLRSATGNLNHLGVHKAPPKTSLSYQNKNRSWELFRNYYYHLLGSLGQQKGFNPDYAGKIQNQVQNISVGLHHHKFVFELV